MQIQCIQCLSSPELKVFDAIRILILKAGYRKMAVFTIGPSQLACTIRLIFDLVFTSQHPSKLRLVIFIFFRRVKRKALIQDTYCTEVFEVSPVCHSRALLIKTTSTLLPQCCLNLVQRPALSFFDVVMDSYFLALKWSSKLFLPSLSPRVYFYSFLFQKAQNHKLLGRSNKIK